jgi:hypothetical protein
LDLVHFLVGQPLDLISTHLQSDGDLGTALESSAWLFGRAGPAWVRISVDRGGSAKTEVVQARLQGGEMWTADRAKLIDSLGTIHHQTDPSWARAERACLGDLATAVRSSGAVAPPDLWSHLATLQTVEAAYSQSKILGWQPMERE